MSDGYARAIQVVRQDSINKIVEFREAWVAKGHAFDYDVKAWTGEKSEGTRLLDSLIESMNDWANIPND